MRLNQFGIGSILYMAEAVAWSYRLIRNGHDAWILPDQVEGYFQVWYEHPRGDIEAPAVGWQIRWHTADDGFTGPVRSINIAAGIKPFAGEIKCPLQPRSQSGATPLC